MESSRLSKNKIRALLQENEHAQVIAEHYWLAHLWERLVFSADYVAPEVISDLIVPTEFGKTLLKKCTEHKGVPIPDATLALYGLFFWHEVLIDCSKSDLNGTLRLLNEELFGDRVRTPYIWGRELHDRLHDQPGLAEHDQMPHDVVWDYLTGTPIGVSYFPHISM